MTAERLRAALGGAAEAEPGWRAEVARLARLHPVEYDREREAAAERLRIRVATLDRAVSRERGEDQPASGGGRASRREAPVPCAEPVAGDGLLAEIAAVFRRHLALPPYADTALALWVLHTHAFEASPITPRLAITSPEKRCGKTTALEIVGALAAKPRLASNITSAATFRLIELERPTLLIDEADTFLGEAEELRGVLNSGHRRTGEVIRAQERDGQFVPVGFSTFAPVAIAMIGKLPGTLEDRSVAVRMSRRAAGERLERWRCDRLDRFAPLVSRCARWAADHLAALTDAEPEVPAALHDRAADNWRPLLAIADAAGGEWPAKARAAALALSGDDDADSHATMLLADVRALFLERGGPDRLPSQTVVAELGRMEHRPWPEISGGRPITTAKLARLLGRFGIAPTRDGSERFYRREAFAEAWERYLAPAPADEPSTRHDPSTGAGSGGARGVNGDGADDGLGGDGKPVTASVRDGLTGWRAPYGPDGHPEVLV